MTTHTATTPKYMAVQGAAVLIGALLLLIGALGFIPGITTGYGGMSWWGPDSSARLFDMFAVSALHNVVHLTIGAVGLWAARSYAGARAYLLGGGLIYLGLFGYGLAIGYAGVFNVLPVNGADIWLHLALGIIMIVLGLTLAGRHDPTKRRRLRRAAR